MNKLEIQIAALKSSQARITAKVLQYKMLNKTTDDSITYFRVTTKAVYLSWSPDSKDYSDVLLEYGDIIPVISSIGNYALVPYGSQTLFVHIMFIESID